MYVVMEMLLKTLLFVLLLFFSFELCFPEKLTLFYFSRLNVLETVNSPLRKSLRGTQWICSSKYLFFRHIFAGWEMWKK